MPLPPAAVQASSRRHFGRQQCAWVNVGRLLCGLPSCLAEVPLVCCHVESVCVTSLPRASLLGWDGCCCCCWWVCLLDFQRGVHASHVVVVHLRCGES